MADKTTIARPYARAAFAEAKGEQRLQPWSQALRTAAKVVQDPRVHSLLGNPAVAHADLAQFLIDLAGADVNEHARNFLRMLAENRRLGYLPEISGLFDELKDEDKGVVNVTVVSAAPLAAGQRDALTSAMKHKLRRQIRLHCATDPALIGGAVLRAGDLVIDGSLRSRLDRIAYELTA